MTLLDAMVRSIWAQRLLTDPMHYIELPDFFPMMTYYRMVTDLPPLADYKILSEDSRKGAGTRAILTLGRESKGVWADVVAAMSSPAFTATLLDKFKDALETRFSTPIENISKMKFAPLVRLLRDVEGFKIAPHCDKPSKVITLQVYLPPDDSQSDLGTSIYRQTAGGFEEARRVPFIPNYGYAFPMTHVDKPSWHGVETVGKLAYPRDSIIFGLHR